MVWDLVSCRPHCRRGAPTHLVCVLSRLARPPRWSHGDSVRCYSHCRSALLRNSLTSAVGRSRKTYCTFYQWESVSNASSAIFKTPWHTFRWRCFEMLMEPFWSGHSRFCSSHVDRLWSTWDRRTVPRWEVEAPTHPSHLILTTQTALKSVMWPLGRRTWNHVKYVCLTQTIDL